MEQVVYYHGTQRPEEVTNEGLDPDSDSSHTALGGYQSHGRGVYLARTIGLAKNFGKVFAVTIPDQRRLQGDTEAPGESFIYPDHIPPENIYDPDEFRTEEEVKVDLDSLDLKEETLQVSTTEGPIVVEFNPPARNSHFPSMSTNVEVQTSQTRRVNIGRFDHDVEELTQQKLTDELLSVLQDNERLKKALEEEYNADYSVTYTGDVDRDFVRTVSEMIVEEVRRLIKR